MQPIYINERVEKIKGDEGEINRFVEEYKPFIASCTEKVTGRYVRFGEDDELSIALMAFVEAIESFDSSKSNFLSFARNVISRRLIDYYRKEKKYVNVVSLNEYYNEDKEEIDLGTAESIDRYSIEEINEYRRLEIAELKEELKKWDITFEELVESSPKHKKTRKMCSDITGYILSKPDIIKFIKQKKYIPFIEIEEALKIPRKKMERLRKYIIAVIIIATGDYMYIKDYIRDYMKTR